MIRAIHLTVIGLSWGGFAFRLRVVWRRPVRPAAVVFSLLLLVFALAVTIGLPPLYRMLPVFGTRPSLVRLVQQSLTVLSCMLAQVLFVYLVSPAARTRRPIVGRVALAGAVLVAMSVLFLSAPIGDGAEDLVAAYSRKPFVAEYLLVFLGYITVGFVDLCRLTSHYTRQAMDRMLHIGVRLLGLTAVPGTLFVAHKALYTVVGRFGGVLPWPEGPVSTTLVGVSFVPFFAGATIAGWGPRIVSFVHLSRRFRCYRDIRPLWLAACEVLPGLALLEAPGRGLAQWRALDLRLYRCVIEVLDAGLELRRYVDRRDVELARRLGVAAGLSGDQLDTATAAAGFAAALRRRGENRLADDPPGDPLFAVGPGSGQEYVRRVALAYRRSPVVAAVIAGAGH